MQAPPAHHAVLTGYAQSVIRFKARQLSTKAGFSQTDEDDITQELTLYLLERAHLFDPNRASANTFAERVIRSKVAMQLRDRRRKKRAAGFTAQSLERTRALSDEDSGFLRDMLTEGDLYRRLGTAASDQNQVELTAAVEEALSSLPAEDREICRQIIEGTMTSIARDLGVSRRQIRNAIARIRRHFEAASLGDY